MNRDPLWCAIKQKLAGPVDPACFERCMQDILREVYPSLTPVVGGSDCGMDGAVASPDGPLPLICTTGQDVIGNFRTSVQNHLKRRGGPHRCVLATSQFLTPQRRDNILDEAKRLGVTILNIHDGEDVVGRLYGNAKWRKELLGISGDPPVLSCYPRRVRSPDASLVVGREEDIAWLRTTQGHLLLVGQPGSGKTHIHQHLAMQGGALFLVAASTEAGRVADAIRELNPAVIVVDDAHVHLDQLDLLRRLRVEIGAGFVIHANCWPHAEAEVRDRLGIGPSNVRALELLAQRQIKQIIEVLGVFGPDSLLHLIIQQAGGRPGLAAALVEACKVGNTTAVWSGDALADSLLVGRQLVGDEADRTVLGSFAIGGNAGMPPAKILEHLCTTRLDLRRRLAAFGTGGVVAELNNGLIAVQPAALQPVLVRDVFFNGLARLDFRQFLDFAPSRSSALHVLLSTRQRGVDVPVNVLESEVAQADKTDLWEHFGWVDEITSRLILEKYPQHIPEAAAGLFNFHADLTLRTIVRACLAKPRSSTGLEDGVMGVLRRWICNIDELDQTAERREKVLDTLEHVLVNDTSLAQPGTIIRLIVLILDPTFSDRRTPPGEPMTIQLHSGILPLQTVQKVATMWPRILDILKEVPGHTWKALIEGICGWIWPSHRTFARPIADDVYACMVACGKRMLEDLTKLPACTRVAYCHIATVAKAGKLGLTIPSDRIMRTLFRERDRATDFQKRAERRSIELRLLADQLLPEGPRSVVDALGAIEREVADYGGLQGGWDRWIAYAQLAEKCADPCQWLQEMIAAKMPADAVGHFLSAIAQRQRPELETRLGTLMTLPEYRGLAIQCILETEHVDLALLEDALSTFSDAQGISRYRFSGQGITLQAMKGLLRHKNEAVREAAALGEWMRHGDRGISKELLADWSEAVLTIKGRGQNSYLLERMFAKYTELAKRWVAQKLQDERSWLCEDEAGFKAAGQVLSLDERRASLGVLRSRPHFDEGVWNALVGADVKLFREWIREVTDEHKRLMPLHGASDESWIRLAQIAFEEGATPEQVWQHTRLHGSHGGPLSDYYRKRLAFFEGLVNHPDKRFRWISDQGLRWARSSIEREEMNEKREAVFGM